MNSALLLACQISDLHVKAPARLSYRVVNCAAMLARCVAEILRLPQRPDLVLATGDLTDSGRAEEYAHLRALLAPLPMPVYFIPGNHDERGALRAAFPEHAYLPQPGAPGSARPRPRRRVGLEDGAAGVPASRLGRRRRRRQPYCVHRRFRRTLSLSGGVMPVTGLNHYLIVAKNLERTRDFYCKVLGMELAERPDFGFPGYWLKVGDEICVHLASQDPNRIRDMFLLKKHPKGTTGSGSVDHIAFLAQNPGAVRERIQKNRVAMHFRSFPDAKLFQIFLKDPNDITIELNFLGEVIDEKEWQGKGSASAMTLTKAQGKRTSLPRQK